MKKGIHPTYYEQARVTCSCGDSWLTGSVMAEIRTDICNSCHPFYTGEQRIVDTAGQVDRFMKRLGQFSQHKKQAKSRGLAAQKKREQRFLKQQLVALELDQAISDILQDNMVITVGDLEKSLQSNQQTLLELKDFSENTLDYLNKKITTAREVFFQD